MKVFLLFSVVAFFFFFFFFFFFCSVALVVFGTTTTRTAVGARTCGWPSSGVDGHASARWALLVGMALRIPV
ncbi:MAG UNVERIFIED_CONTAM: hypothetical protein LVR29_05285 [Microcystis novacekii LVE1205-3]